MKKCWEFEAKNRPEFSEITKKLINISNDVKDIKFNIKNKNEIENNNILNSVPKLLNNEIELEEKFSKVILKDENLKKENLELKENKQNFKEEINNDKNKAKFDSTSYLMKIENLFKIKFYIFSGKKKSKFKKKLKKKIKKI
jgi:hypothetical protein